MSARRPTAGLRRAAAGARRGLVAVMAGAFLAACAQIPTTGPVEAGPSPGDDVPRVSIDPRPPGTDARPDEIVRGFLDAMSSYQLGFPVARTYLAPDTDWDPASTIVYDRPETITASDDGTSVVFAAPKIATIEDTGRYVAADPNDVVTFALQLVKVDGQWRISGPPTWLLISTLDLAANYAQYETYYPALGGDVLVPDLVWLPATGGDLPLLLADELVDGPSAALGDAVRGFPDGTRVVDVTMEPGGVRVQLSQEAAAAPAADRTLMAAQIVYTSTLR